MNGLKTNIKNCSFEEIEKYLISIKVEKYRAKQVYEWLWKKNASSFSEMDNLPISVREKLNKDFSIIGIKVNSIQTSRDFTAKFGFLLNDGEIIEGVLIPSSGRSTACISTQVGCPLGCKFCATGMLKYKRNLTSSEIIDQVVLINNYSLEKFQRKLSNIVYMGMGEPLLNLDNVLKSIDIITSGQGLGFSPQRITLSTSGLTNEIKKLADLEVKFNIAISLHTANNAKRTLLMPVNKSNPISELILSLKYFNKKTRQRITFEYLLLNNYNDTLNDAKELAEFCKNFPCKINLIEYNPVDESIYKKSSEEKTNQFIEFLKNKNLVVHLRRSRGTDIDAACGQLANKNLKVL